MISNMKKQQHDSLLKDMGKGFALWFIFCAVMSLVMTGLIIWGLVEGILWLRQQ